jgi:HEPN domain-containing protein
LLARPFIGPRLKAKNTLPSAAAQLWLDKALEDEQVVRLVRANGGPWSMAANHVQQAAEKYLKALLVERGVAPRKTHDLEQLIALIPGTSPDSFILAAAAMTSSYAWVTRYPGGAAFGETDIDQAVRDLLAIKNWVLALL